MDSWTSQSNSGMQIITSVVCSVVGLALAIGFRDFGTLDSNARAGFMLGLLLLVIGVIGILMTGRQTVVVDPRVRRILINDSYLFGAKKRTIPFGDVVSVSIGYLGKSSNYVRTYYLVLKLKSGEEYPLFAPGRFFEGASERYVVEGWRQRLEEFLRR